jgi:hypothetical protein
MKFSKWYETLNIRGEQVKVIYLSRIFGPGLLFSGQNYF